MTSYEWLSVIIQGAAVFVGTVVCIIYWGQLKAMKESVLESSKAAKAARDSADIAKQTLIISQRAYIHIGNWKQTNFEVGGAAEIAFTVRNSGHTPARLVESSFTRVISESLPPIPVYGPTVFNEGGLVLGPGAAFEKNSTVSDGLTKVQFDDISAGRRKLWYFGYTTYRDVFEDTPLRTLCYCVVFDLATKTFMADSTPSYNHSD